MEKATWVRSSAVCALMICCLPVSLSYGAVTADPGKVTFTSPRQSASVRVLKDGAPVAAADIRAWRLLANGHDYIHMLRVDKADGVLTLSPSNTVEVGSYRLNIETAAGPVTVQVYIPLSDLPDVVEKMVAATGLSERAIKARLGLATSMGREEVTIDLPPVYYEGQTLEMAMPIKAGRSSAWFMNEAPVKGRPGGNGLSYTFPEPGEYILTYLETEQQNGRTIAVARARAYTRVVPLPAVSTQAAVNTKIEFAPPSGYRKHLWRIDGQEFSTEPTLLHAFAVPGVYTVQCVASSPSAGPAGGFMRIRYDVTVKPR